MREYDAVDDLSGGEMEEDGQTLSMSMAEHSSDEAERGVDLLPMESDDGHGELVSPIYCTSSSLPLTTTPPQPNQFPETARRQVPGPGPNQQPHVRRKSVIPLDASILRELASHKSCVPLSPTVR